MNNMFDFFMNLIGEIVSCIIVVGIILFLILVPFLIKGGKILFIPIIIYLICLIGVILSNDNKRGEDRDDK